ncbi:hypothetical protein [Priestia megaterium]|uniref:hypothetical protein n=1 Tax=Priestia megaterium TaxID=1404 RepID=UPI000BFD59A8|nr:hypothetical protein [Priestia megaterium]PGQ88260.1 hypothetical protein COA18_04855 [Priestia megaterium]
MKKHDILIQGAIKELNEMAAKSISGMGGYQAKLIYMNHLTEILSGRRPKTVRVIDPKRHLAVGEGQMKQENCLVITANWIRESGCLRDDLSIDTDKLDEIIAGRSFVIDEVTFLPAMDGETYLVDDDRPDEKLKILGNLFRKNRLIANNAKEGDFK